MIIIDNETVILQEQGSEVRYQIGTPEAFQVLSELWLRSGWDTKYVYSFSWLGRPIIQLPEDMVRIQEVVFDIKPDFIVETGIAHGGSLVFYATLCKAMEHGHVIGVDIEIRPHNKKAINEHFLKPYITTIEGDSTSQETFDAVRRLIPAGSTVVVMLDSNHTKEHVLKELRLYSGLVSIGSYIVVMDGIMSKVVGAPRSSPDWAWDNPMAASKVFVAINPNFEIVEPEFLFNEGQITDRVTYWPGAYLKRVS